MPDKLSLRAAVNTAWSVYRATHPGIDNADRRRCLLERYLSGRLEADDSNAEELAGFGIAYLNRFSDEEC